MKQRISQTTQSRYVTKNVCPYVDYNDSTSLMQAYESMQNWSTTIYGVEGCRELMHIMYRIEDLKRFLKIREQE